MVNFLNQIRTLPKSGVVLRISLSIVAAYLFLYFLVLVAGVHKTFLKSKQLRESPSPVVLGSPHLHTSQSRRGDALWPEFPRSGQSNFRRSIINGIEVHSEDWETAAAPDEILNYYRQQMVARGWRDATEETYGLQPQVREWGPNQQSVQNEEYLQVYRKVMDSSLVFRRGSWSLHVLVEPRKGSLHGSFVKLYGAATPSVKEFFAGLAGSRGPNLNGKSAGQTLDATQFSGGERYHTTVELKPLAPEQALDQELSRFQNDGWKPMAAAPGKRNRASSSVWLTKGDAYAVVVVDRAPANQGTSVTITQVTPDSSAH